jgi:nitrogen fixation/metabolism regulation signal transduction histidine kinase
MLEHVDLLSPFRQYWFVTITPYGRDIEPNVPDKNLVIDSFRRLCESAGPDNMCWRYDPVFIDKTWTVQRHIESFSAMCGKLEGYTHTCVISYIDLYEKVLHSFPKVRSVPFEIQMELKNVSYTHDVFDMSVKCDKNWTIEAIQNVVKNCIEHMESGGMLLIKTSDTNIYKEISVEDTGCGIAEEDLPHIFDRFYKGKNAGKDSVGIGLALAKTIITGQRGDIVVESTEGVGTRFCLRFYKTLI